MRNDTRIAVISIKSIGCSGCYRGTALAKIHNNRSLGQMSLDEIAAYGPPCTDHIICIEMIY